MTDSARRFNYQGYCCIYFLLEECCGKNNDREIYYENIDGFLELFSITLNSIEQDLVQCLDDIIIHDPINKSIKFIQIKTTEQDYQNKGKSEIETDINNMIIAYSKLEKYLIEYEIEIIYCSNDSKTMETFICDINKTLPSNVKIRNDNGFPAPNKMEKFFTSRIQSLTSKIFGFNLEDGFIDSFINYIQNNKSKIINQKSFLDRIRVELQNTNEIPAFLRKLMVFDTEKNNTVTNSTYKHLISQFKTLDEGGFDPIKDNIDQFISENQIILEAQNIKYISDIIGFFQPIYGNRTYVVFLNLLDQCTLNLGIKDMPDKKLSILTKFDLVKYAEIKDFIKN